MRPDRFKHFVAIDWSGAVGPRQKGIAIAVADSAGGPPVLVRRGGPWSRAEVLEILSTQLPRDCLVGMDLGISLPFADCESFFPGWGESPASARELWRLVDEICFDDPHLAASSCINHHCLAPYFRRQGEIEGAHFRCDGAQHGRGRFRVTEAAQAKMGCQPYSNFNLVGAAQVGKSSLTGMRLLQQLPREIAVWPVDPLPDQGSVICEIYTSLAAVEAGRIAGRTKLRSFAELNAALARLGAPPVQKKGAIDDNSSDALLTAAWLRKVAHQPHRWSPEAMTEKIAATEGWTFGAF